MEDEENLFDSLIESDLPSAEFSAPFKESGIAIRTDAIGLGDDVQIGDGSCTPDGGNNERVVVLNNFVEWGLAASITAPFGMHLQGGGTFNRRNIRDNAFKRMDDQNANNSENGIYFENDVRWGTVLIDNSVMGIGTDLDNGISHVNAANGNIKIFNNLRSDGQFFQAKNRDGFHDQELTTDVEAVMFNA